jgi:hypothetical protein
MLFSNLILMFTLRIFTLFNATAMPTELYAKDKLTAYTQTVLLFQSVKDGKGGFVAKEMARIHFDFTIIRENGVYRFCDSVKTREMKAAGSFKYFTPGKIFRNYRVVG